jgi:hypothetical protein
MLLIVVTFCVVMFACWTTGWIAACYAIVRRAV